jgi:predicted PurR-regulated permease PerM
VALVIALLVLGFFGLLLPILYTQGRTLYTAISDAMPRVIDSITSAADSLESRLSDGSTEDFKVWAKQWWERLNLDMNKIGQQISAAATGISKGGGDAIGGVFDAIGSFFSSIFGAVFTAIFALVIAFYYLLEFDAIPRLIRTILPTDIEDRTMEVLHKVDVAMGGFLRGQLIVCSLIGLLTTIGLSLIGMYKYALIVGVIAGSANFIPYLGPTMGATPAILWAIFSQSHETWGERGLYIGLILGLFALIQMIDGYIFQPKIVGKSANLHPLVVMGALLLGAQFGVGGMIIAVPSACIARVLFKELWWDEHLERKKREKAEAADLDTDGEMA